MKEPVGLDPYLTWARLTGFHGYRLRTRSGSVGPRLEVLIESDAGFPMRARRRFPHLAIGESPLEGASRLYAVDCTTQELEELLRPGAFGVVKFELASARFAPAVAGEDVVPATGTRAVEARTGSGTASRCSASHVLVVIDDGFGFLNSAFADRKGSCRIFSFWDQGGSAGTAPWQKATGFAYGAELAGKEIQRLWRHRKSASDEEAIYRAIGYGAARYTRTHGTHVAGCAVGSVDPSLDYALILVQLPRDVSTDTSGAGTARHILDGLRYALDRVSPSASVVVNISFGALAGPHDGTTLLERSLDAWVQQEQRSRGFAIFLPAGNAFGGLGHASASIRPGAALTLPWQVRRDDPTESFCEIWYPRHAFGSLAIRLLDPSGRPSRAFHSGAEEESGSSSVEAALIHARMPSAGADKSMSLCALAPTAPLDSSWNAARSGRWSVELRNTSKVTVRVDAWIQRDNAVTFGPYPSRQSFFPPEGLPRTASRDDDFPSDSQARRGTGNCIAHGTDVVVVGGVYGEDFALTDYTSMLPRVFGRPWPDLLAISDKSRMRPGVLGLGTFSGTYVWMNGTSVAAPHAAGVALGLVAPKMNTQTLRMQLAKRSIGRCLATSAFETDRAGSGMVV